jgi:carbon storage regulator
MLVLSRKVGERIFIGENISVTVVRVAQGVVRLGVEAPDSLPILREEVKNLEMEVPSPSGRRLG